MLKIFAASIAVALFAVAGPARAFTIGSVLTDACHEEIGEAALATAREQGLAPAIEPDANERALIDDLPFPVDGDLRELAAASFLLGIRDNDLKGRAASELDQLAIVHGDPATQEEHCLRAAGDDEPDGSRAAIERCRAFIRDRARSALDALGRDGRPDPSARQDLDVSLALRGGVTASLPAFWVRIGQAAHALQDSFAHTYRTSDGMRVTVVLDWIDLVEGHEDEARDGPPHKLDLDDCNAGDAIRSRNKALATDATLALLAATLDPTTDRAAKEAAIDDVLDRYLTYSPGCTFDNRWCDAPENAYVDTSACACRAAGGDGASAAGALVLLAAGIAALARRRRRWSAPAAAFFAFVAFLALASTEARADEAVAAAPLTSSDVALAAKEREHASRFALAADVSGSYSDVALAGGVGAHVRVNDRFVLGVEGELNAWYGVNSGRLALGSANIYALGILRFPMRYQPINLRTTLEAGVAIELLDLYGVPTGSVGPFVGAYPLGLEFKASGHVFVVLNPLGVAVPMPHLTGTPFVYPQFRSELGLEESRCKGCAAFKRAAVGGDADGRPGKVAAQG